ncbi:hypothetical protein ACFPK1_12060 [Actinomycetospora rhizophila]|uniref:MFS transporter n=1 Tax=Actinomycetospora rhizophila TaxID=1416876 RepID=A0ABV9ZF09_9PSEU
MRVVGVVAGFNVINGLPGDRTSIGAALVDTTSEVTSGVGVPVVGTVVAALFTGAVAATPWSPTQGVQFAHAVTVSGLVLTAVAAALVGGAILRTRRAG